MNDQDHGQGQGEVFLDEEDVIQEIQLDEEGRIPVTINYFLFCSFDLFTVVFFIGCLVWTAELPDADDEDMGSEVDAGKGGFDWFCEFDFGIVESG